jgi:DNA polymerase-1
VEDPAIKVLYNRRGVSDYAFYDEAGIEERTGVHPTRYVEYAALRGDPSDNLPGVPGVGEKTAAKLINKYDGLDGIFEHLDEQTPKLRENLAEHEAQVRENAEVMVLVRDVELAVEIDDLVMGDYDVEAVRNLFGFLEFRTLYDRLAEALETDLGPSAASEVEVLEAEVTSFTEASEAVTLLEGLAKLTDDGPLAVEAAYEGVPYWCADLLGLALVTDADGAEVAWLPVAVLDDPKVRDALEALLGPGGRPLAAHDAKPLLAWMLRTGRSEAALAIDTSIAAYLIDPADTGYQLQSLLLKYASLELPSDATAPDGQLDFDDDGGVEVGLEAGRRALAVGRLAPRLLDALDKQGLRALHDDIETPLVGVLARMEVVGVGVDATHLRELHDTLKARCDELQQQIWEDAGEEFVINSTPQLRTILYEKLGLTPQKRTKTGYSTDAQTLQKLEGQHPIIEHLLSYREVEKLRSTYGEGLLAEVRDDGRIHATFNQTVARTGRLSSDAPNLHNIPVRSDLGRTFRAAFVPAKGCKLLVADYNQIELRCIAHLAEDPGLVAAFTAGEDIHTATASRVFKVEPGDVTPAQRAKSKMVSYGLAYGMESFGLAQRLNIEVQEASEILKAYFEAFPSVKQYMDRTVYEARERGYTETLFGRRRPIPELSASNVRIRQAGERQAMNAGIQGLAADIFKVALVRLDQALQEQDAASRLILQVHDEVLLEVPPSEMDAMQELTLASMHGAADLRVPLEVNIFTGDTWADAKG